MTNKKRCRDFQFGGFIGDSLHKDGQMYLNSIMNLTKVISLKHCCTQKAIDSRALLTFLSQVFKIISIFSKLFQVFQSYFEVFQIFFKFFKAIFKFLEIFFFIRIYIFVVCNVVFWLGKIKSIKPQTSSSPGYKN